MLDGNGGIIPVSVIMPECCITCKRYTQSYNDCRLHPKVNPWYWCDDYKAREKHGLLIDNKRSGERY